MSDPESRLEAVLRADAPPERDAIFRVDVLARLERTRFRRRVTLAAVIATIAAVLAVAVAPPLDVWLAANVYLLAVVVAGAACALLALSRLWLSPRAGVTQAARSLGRWLYP